LNADTGDVAYDISGNRNNGTIDEAKWDGDDIYVEMIDGYDYWVNNNTGDFALINNARDRTWVEISYTYFEWDSDFLQQIIIKILPGMLIMLVLIMIIRFFTGRTEDTEDTYGYEY